MLIKDVWFFFFFVVVIEFDSEFTNRIKEDRKYLAKTTNRRPHSCKYYIGCFYSIIDAIYLKIEIHLSKIKLDILVIF